jgi:hypothetical protein
MVRRDQTIARTTPPSTRSAAPVVADARALQTATIIAAIASGVANRWIIEGLAFLKKSRSTVAAPREPQTRHRLATI